MTNVNAADYRHLLNKRYVIQKYTQGTAPPLIPHLACCTNFQTPQTAMVEENEEETTELEKCDCCTPFDPAKFVDVDNPSYFTEAYLKKRPFQPHSYIGCDKDFILKIDLEKANPTQYFSMRKGRSKGPPRQCSLFKQ